MNGERREAVVREPELFRADAELNEREQQVGRTAHAYPQSLGEWLGTAVEIGAAVSWQAYYALRLPPGQTDHEQLIAQQGRSYLASERGRRATSTTGSRPFQFGSVAPAAADSRILGRMSGLAVMTTARARPARERPGSTGGAAAIGSGTGRRLAHECRRGSAR